MMCACTYVSGLLKQVLEIYQDVEALSLPPFIDYLAVKCFPN